MNVKNFNWPTGLFVIIYHLMLLVVWPLYFSHYSPTWGMWAITVVLYFLTGMSITAGYHRFYSHQAYKAHPLVEGMLLFFGSMATQGSALRWSFEHRIHHAYVDTDRDPYSIKKGFWYAHILWLFQKPNPIDTKVVADLSRNRLVMFQHKHYVLCMVVTNILAFLCVGWFFSDFVGAFVLAWWTRLFFLHHSTWFINSLAHTWGAQTFSQEQTAVDNYVISLLTFGEGYHNYHHTFANDYRNGIRWYHYDPTKWLIWVLARMKLASNLKRINKYHIKERIVVERKERLCELLKNSFIARKEELYETVSKVSADLTAKMAQIRNLLEQTSRTQEKKNEIKTLKRGLREDWKQFKQLYKIITRQRVSLKD